MTTLVLLGGPVGVGKSAALAALRNRIPRSALVEADDVWRVSDDIVVEEGRSFAHTNLNAVIAGYFAAGVETCVVSWVFARPELYDPVIERARSYADAILQLYLVATPETLAHRIRMRGEAANNDIEGLIGYSLSRLELIQNLPFDKIDTSDHSSTEVADKIVRYVESKRRRA